MKKRFLSVILALCMLLALLPGGALGVENENRPVADRLGGGPLPGDVIISCTPELDEPEPPTPERFAATRDIPIQAVGTRNIEYNTEANGICINNNPVVIKLDESDGKTYFYDETGMNKLTIYGTDGAVYATQNIDDKTIYGGSRQFLNESGDTDIVMESGSVKTIFGGDVYSNRVGNTSVVITGGTVTNSVFGGSFGYVGYGHITGDTYVEISGSAQCKQVFGGGYQQGSLVTGTCTVVAEDSAKMEWLFGGACEGEVGDVSLAVETGVTGTYLYAGGYNASAVAQDVTVDFNGSFHVVAGSCSGTARNVTMTIGPNALATQVICAGGFEASSVIDSTHLILNGGAAKQESGDGYIYGGGIGGKVTGNVTIDVNQGQSIGWPYLRGGGETLEATVGGNVTINCNTFYYGGITCGGYEGAVQGTATLNMTRTGPNPIDLIYYLNGSGISAAVDGGSTLILKDAEFQFNSDVLNFQTIALQGATLQPIPASYTQKFQNLVMDENSTLLLNGSSLNVNGNFDGGGAIKVTAGETFSVAGTTTGTTKLSVLGSAVDYNIPTRVKAVGGANAAVEHYALVSPTDYTLLAQSDGLYAVWNGDTAGLTISAPSKPTYGDPLSITVSAEQGKVTSAAEVLLRVYKSGQSAPVYTKTVQLSDELKALFNDLPVLTAGTYSISATLSQGGQAKGSATQSIEIGKRTLTVKPDSYSVFTRPYVKNSTDIKLPYDFFKNAILVGYCGTDSGGKLPDAAILYRMSTDSAGTNKKNDCAVEFLTLVAIDGVEVVDKPINQKPSYIYANYRVAAPALTVNITPRTVDNVSFPQTTINMRVGTPLSECALFGGTQEGTFAWKAPAAAVRMGKNDYDVVFTPADAVNNDYSGIAGWDGATKTITQGVAVTGSKKEAVTPQTAAQTYTVSALAQDKELALSALCAMPVDAGAITYSYSAAGSSVTQLTNIAVTEGKLTFTIPANATEGEERIAIKIFSELYADSTLMVDVSLTAKKAVEITGIQIDSLNDSAFRVYTGAAATYSGTPVITGGYAGEPEYIWFDQEAAPLSAAPVDVGRYQLMIRVPLSDETYAGSAVLTFHIVSAPLTLRAKSYAIQRGADAPVYEAEVLGLLGGDRATATASCRYQKGDPVGAYPIIPGNSVTFTAGKTSNYRITNENGTLTVEQPAPSGGGGGVTTYTITATAGEHGSITPSGKVSVSRNADRSFTVKPDEGYAIADVLVDGASVGAVSTYTFEKVTKGHTISVSFAEKPAEHKPLSFADVDAGAWYYDAVAYVCEKGLFTGTSATTFSPELSMSRAMLWTVLARMDGQDVNGGATWYEKAQTWAAAQGVTDGANPEADMTREQLAVMLYRYAKAEKTDADLKNFFDADSISPWAADAMSWAVARGILTGKSGSRLDPQSTASRAEVATMLQRFVEPSKK